MSLHSLNLDAFLAVAKQLSFSRAAKQLHVTQSALSQRLMNLEQSLELTLFIRERSGLVLTEAGEKLLRYCQMKTVLEEEFLSDLKLSSRSEMGGVLRIGAYSSVMRSVIVRALSPFLRANPKIQCELMIREMDDLVGLLESAKADFIVLDQHLGRAKIEERVLGSEVYVVIESAKFKSPENVYLDNSPQDRATEKFFQFQKIKTPSFKRSFMGDVYGILDGVCEGMGRAVMPQHLLSKKIPVKVVSSFRPQPLDVTLHYHLQPFYSRLQSAIIEVLTAECPKFLSQDSQR